MSNIITPMPNESELAFIWRIGQAKDAGELNLNWEQIADIVNANFHEDDPRKESAYRKPYANAVAYNREVFQKQTAVISTTPTIDKHEATQQMIQMRDERRALQAEIRNLSRANAKMDCLEEYIKAQGRVDYSDWQPQIVGTGDTTTITIMLTDWHIGAEFNSKTGYYNTSVAKDRLQTLLGSVHRIAKTHNAKKCVIALLGDLISGNIHLSVQVKNRENVIEQIATASEMVASFTHSLAQIFDRIDVYSISGNHSRIAKKDEAIKEERLDSLPIWYTKAKLSHIPNVHCHLQTTDSTYDVVPIEGKIYVLVHGDYDAMNDNATARLVMMLGYKPYAILRGHNHHFAADEVNGVKVIQGGSLAGSGDDFTVQKRMSGKPSQTVLVCTPDGIECIYPVEM